VPFFDFIAKNVLWTVASVFLLVLGILLLVIGHYRGKVSRIEHKLEYSQSNVRALLDTLYGDARFTLIRYEGELKIENAAGDCTLRKTYVLKADQPEHEMACYVEARADDDLDRIFSELRVSCVGGKIREGYRRLYSSSEGVILVSFVIELMPPVHRVEHTVFMQCKLKGYFASEHFAEYVHMMLPTKRSIMKFSFPDDVVVSNETATLLDGLANEQISLSNGNFSRSKPNDIKWEIADSGFGCFYKVEFDIAHKA
jgi:hypothetical protein